MTPCHLPYVGRRRGVFASEDARFGMLVQLRAHATRGRRLEDAWFGTAVRAGFRSRGGDRRGRASAASHSRYAGECPLCGAPTTIDTGALRTEPPLRVIASAAGECPLFSATTTVDTGASRTEPPLRATAFAAGNDPLYGAPTTIDIGALRTEPPLCVTASTAEITSSPRSITAEKPSLEQPLHELMTFVMGRS